MGGKIDGFLMRFTDLFICLPQLPLLLLISFLYRDEMFAWADEKFGNGNIGIFILIVFVIAILNWMSTARLVRAEFLRLKEKEFVEAAKSIGAKEVTLMMRHILPNVVSQIIVAATLAVGAAIITESTLSFLGLGFPSDVPDLGTASLRGEGLLPVLSLHGPLPGHGHFPDRAVDQLHRRWFARRIGSEEVAVAAGLGVLRPGPDARNGRPLASRRSLRLASDRCQSAGDGVRLSSIRSS